MFLVLEIAKRDTVPTPFAKAKHELPPLILHPLAGYGQPVEGPAEVRRMELNMLCCLGKDLNRWLEQCVESAAYNPALRGLKEVSFISLLVDDPPASVADKMKTWGVGGFPLIFSRALGLNSVFPQLPPREQISPTMVRDFPLYADALYRARRNAQPAAEMSSQDFIFEVYAAGEYARILEKSWGL